MAGKVPVWLQLMENTMIASFDLYLFVPAYATGKNKEFVFFFQEEVREVLILQIFVYRRFKRLMLRFDCSACFT